MGWEDHRAPVFANRPCPKVMYIFWYLHDSRGFTIWSKVPIEVRRPPSHRDWVIETLSSFFLSKANGLRKGKAETRIKKKPA